MNKKEQPQQDQYRTIKRVGHGNFGEALLVESQMTKHRFIMKRVNLEGRNRVAKEMLLQEIELMRSLKHPFIIKYRESFVLDKRLCIVMEYAEGGDLEQELERTRLEKKVISEERAVSIAVQLLLAVQYVHEQRVVHRDLKADNIFLTKNGEVRLGDFGICKPMQHTFDLAKTKIGTPVVIAPEIWEGHKYNQKSDVWSLGCVFYKLLTLHYPFEAENEGALVFKIYNKPESISKHYSSAFIELIDQMLDCDPRRRPSVHKILETDFIKPHIKKVFEYSLTLRCGNKINKRVINEQNFTKENMEVLIKKELLQEVEPRKYEILEKEANIKSENEEALIREELLQERKLRALGVSSNTTNHFIPRPTSSKQISPKIIQNSHLLSSSLRPRKTLSTLSVSSKCPKSPESERIKIVEYKQNYPILVSENEELVKDLAKSKAEKEELQHKTEILLHKLIQNDSISKEDALQEINQLILNYLYP